MTTPTYDLAPIDPHPNLVANYGRFPVRFVKGEGCWLEDDRGRRFLDALSGIAVNLLGHGHPALTAAIATQAGTLIHTSNLYHVAPQERLAELICAHSFAEQVFFCNSGTESNEAAFKLVRLWGNVVHGGKKTRVVAAESSFHGRTMASISLTGTPKYHEGFEPLFPVTFVPYGDADALAAAMGDDVAGLWLEPLQGEGGVVEPPAGYLARARELCDAHASLLVFDEVQTGCGRCGTLFAHQHEGVVPDAMGLAKGLAGGVPIGALCTTAELGALLKPGTHASTFGGNHLACAAGVVVLEQLLADGFLPGVVAKGERLRAGLAEVFGAVGVEIRGRGLLCGVQLPEETPAGDLAKACLVRGLVVGTAGRNTFRLAPPLVISHDEIDTLVERVASARGT